MSNFATKRFLLFGQTNPWNEFVFQFDTKEEALKEAKERIKLGYQVMLLDNTTKELVEIKMPEVDG